MIHAQQHITYYMQIDVNIDGTCNGTCSICIASSASRIHRYTPYLLFLSTLDSRFNKELISVLNQSFFLELFGDHQCQLQFHALLRWHMHKIILTKSSLKKMIPI